LVSNPSIEKRRGFAGVDRPGGCDRPLRQIGAMPGDQKCGGGIEKNRVAISARFPGEKTAKRLGVVARVAATNGGDGMAGQSRILGCSSSRR